MVGRMNLILESVNRMFPEYRMRCETKGWCPARIAWWEGRGISADKTHGKKKTRMVGSNTELCKLIWELIPEARGRVYDVPKFMIEITVSGICPKCGKSFNKEKGFHHTKTSNVHTWCPKCNEYITV